MEIGNVSDHEGNSCNALQQRFYGDVSGVNEAQHGRVHETLRGGGSGSLRGPPEDVETRGNRDGVSTGHSFQASVGGGGGLGGGGGAVSKWYSDVICPGVWATCLI